jgi:hypothetical protein
MNVSDELTSNLRYFVTLVKAATDGASSALKTASMPSLLRGPVWAPAAVGAVVGASTMRLRKQRKPGYSVAVGGLVGTLLGFGCGLVWAWRGTTGTVARGSMQKVNAVRDAHWVESNPIDYA